MIRTNRIAVLEDAVLAGATLVDSPTGVAQASFAPHTPCTEGNPRIPLDSSTTPKFLRGALGA